MNDDSTNSGMAHVRAAVAVQSREPRAPISADDDGESLIRAVMAGDAWAERELFDRYAPMVHATLRRCLGPVSDIDDLMQEVFLRVFDRVKTLRDSSSLRSFVYTIAVRVARTDIRRIRVRRRSESFDLGDRANYEAVSADPEVREALIRVQMILDGMKAKHRIAFVLRHMDGLSIGDVARELEVSVATVNRWLGRAAHHITREIGLDFRLTGMLDKQGWA